MDDIDECSTGIGKSKSALFRFVPAWNGMELDSEYCAVSDSAQWLTL